MSSTDSYKALGKIWDNVSRPSPDGKKRIFLKGRDDLVYLYSTGFCDEKKYTLLAWVDAFTDSLQPDGSYQVTEEQWMDKIPYHYNGPIGVPFDPRALREGPWSDEEMEKLLREKLLPAVYFSEEELRAIWNEAKPTFFSNGRYFVTSGVKEDMLKMVDEFPSPAQVRALGVWEAHREKRAAAGQTLKKDGSAYSTGPAPSLVAAQKLADILSKTGGKR